MDGKKVSYPLPGLGQSGHKTVAIPIRCETTELRRIKIGLKGGIARQMKTRIASKR